MLLYENHRQQSFVLIYIEKKLVFSKPKTENENKAQIGSHNFKC